MKKIGVMFAILVLCSGFASAGILDNLKDFFFPSETQLSPDCVDSDGFDLFVKGTTSKGSESATDYCSGGRIVEYYCASNGRLGRNTRDCPSGYTCTGGACKTSSTPSTPTPTLSSIKVKATDNSGNPLSGATVKIKQGSTVVTTQITDSTGTTQSTNLNHGETYTFEISKSGYQTKSFGAFKISVSSGIYGPYTLQSTTPSTPSTPSATTRPVRVAVSDSSGNALSGASVEIRKANKFFATGSTQSDGKIYPIALEIGQFYSFIISKAGYQSLTIGPVQITEIGEIYGPYTLQSTAPSTPSTPSTPSANPEEVLVPIRVNVRDSDTKGALFGATVQFKKGSTVVSTQKTNSNGYTPYIDLAIGDAYTFEISKAGYTTESWGAFEITSEKTYGPYSIRPTSQASQNVLCKLFGWFC